MPTTRLKNTVYRLLLPFCSPGCGSRPVSFVKGHSLVSSRSFERLLRRYHVLGSATLLSSGCQSSLICSSSADPPHIASPDTYFRVASITKTATAVLVMHLAEQGILDTDKPVKEYFSDHDAGSSLDGITLRHLLSHTSGLTDPADLESSVEKGIPFSVFLPSCRTDEPGRSFHYSNLGFGLIGCILESVLEEPLGDLYRNHLFAPLGMNSTLEGCLLPQERIMPVTRILPYRKGHDLVLTPLGSRPLEHPDPLRHYGHTAGSMYTDAESLQKLLRVLSGGSGFLSGETISLMKKEHASYGKLSPTLSYGFGLLRIKDPSISGSTVYGHQGFAYGCADGAFWEDSTGNMMIMLNGGCSEARCGRLGSSNRAFLRWAFRKELPLW